MFLTISSFKTFTRSWHRRESAIDAYHDSGDARGELGDCAEFSWHTQKLLFHSYSRSCFFFVVLTTPPPDDDFLQPVVQPWIKPSFSERTLTRASTELQDSGDARGGLGKCDGMLLNSKYVCPSAPSVLLWRNFHSFAEDSMKASWYEATRAQQNCLWPVTPSRGQVLSASARQAFSDADEFTLPFLAHRFTKL